MEEGCTVVEEEGNGAKDFATGGVVGKTFGVTAGVNEEDSI